MTLTLEEIRDLAAAVLAACEGTPAEGLAPKWEDGVPCCSSGCPHWDDGRRCTVIDDRTSWLCETAVQVMARLVLAGRRP